MYLIYEHNLCSRWIVVTCCNSFIQSRLLWFHVEISLMAVNYVMDHATNLL